MSTGSVSSTFTRTHARHIASKVAADLRQMHRFYDEPTLGQIDDFLLELVELLANKWMKSIEYGFKRDDDWIVSLKYTVRSDGTVSDSNAGRVPPGVDVTGAYFYSYLIPTAAYDSAAESALRGLPFRRGGAAEPGHRNGYWESGRSYASGGVGAVREIWRPR